LFWTNLYSKFNEMMEDILAVYLFGIKRDIGILRHQYLVRCLPGFLASAGCDVK